MEPKQLEDHAQRLALRVLELVITGPIGTALIEIAEGKVTLGVRHEAYDGGDYWTLSLDRNEP